MTAPDPWAPRLFTAEEFATLTDQQRRLIQIQRRHAVDLLALEHARRYDAPGARAVLLVALREHDRDHHHGPPPGGPS
jgi:hypothetical protein